MAIVVSDKIKRLLPLALALVMGLLAIFFVHRWITEQRRAIDIEKAKIRAQYQTPIEVLVAAQDLAKGTELEPTHLRMAVVPEKFVQPYAMRAPQQALGKVTIAPIAEGEQILSNKVVRPEEAPVGVRLSGVTPKGTRAVTIAVDTLTGVGGFVRPGDIVDILWTVKDQPSPGQKEGQVITLTLFQDVPVLAVGGDMVGSRHRAAQEQAQPAAGKDSAPYTVTLALTPQETSFLLFAREQGRIQLSLRSPTEKGSRVAVAPANINTLLEAVLGTPTAPPPKPQAPRQVEVYKGLERDVVVLSSEEEPVVP